MFKIFELQCQANFKVCLIFHHCVYAVILYYKQYIVKCRNCNKVSSTGIETLKYCGTYILIAYGFFLNVPCDYDGL